MLETIYIIALLSSVVLLTVFNQLADINVRAKKSIAMLMSVGILWGGLRFIAGSANVHIDATRELFKISLAVTTFAPVFFYRFSQNFPVQSEGLILQPKMLRAYLSATLVATILLFGNSIQVIQKESFSIYVNEYGAGYLIFFLYHLVFFAIVFKSLVLTYRSINNESNKKLLKDLFIAVGLVVIFSIVIGISSDLLWVKTNSYMSLLEFPTTIVASGYFVRSAIVNMKKRNNQLSSELEMNNEILGVLSHQLRTPLTTIANYCNILLSERLGNTSHAQKKALVEIEYSSTRMVRMINEFLDATQTTQKNFIPKLSLVDICSVVDEVTGHYSETVRIKNIIIEVTSQPTVTVLIDSLKITEVLSNFLDNAIAYSGNNGVVQVSLAKEGNKCRLEVTDNGIGVPDKEKQQIFDKFVRASNAKKSRPDGTGLGLYFAKKIIEAHDGEIIFKSKEGKGSTFGFTLPLAQP